MPTLNENNDEMSSESSLGFSNGTIKDSNISEKSLSRFTGLHSKSIASAVDTKIKTTAPSKFEHNDKEINALEESKWTLIILNIAFLTEGQNFNIA